MKRFPMEPVGMSMAGELKARSRYNRALRLSHCNSTYVAGPVIGRATVDDGDDEERDNVRRPGRPPLTCR